MDVISTVGWVKQASESFYYIFLCSSFSFLRWLVNRKSPYTHFSLRQIKIAGLVWFSLRWCFVSSPPPNPPPYHNNNHYPTYLPTLQKFAILNRFHFVTKTFHMVRCKKVQQPTAKFNLLKLHFASISSSLQNVSTPPIDECSIVLLSTTKKSNFVINLF